jgi:hypothetical protein
MVVPRCRGVVVSAREHAQAILALAALRIVVAATGGHCDDCLTYMGRRRTVLAASVNAHAREHQLKPTPLLLAYMAGVHARHLAGLSIGNEDVA